MSKNAEVDWAAIEDEWRTVPTDLGGWANRATAMRVLARQFQEEAAEEYQRGYAQALRDAVAMSPNAKKVPDTAGAA